MCTSLPLMFDEEHPYLYSVGNRTLSGSPPAGDSFPEGGPAQGIGPARGLRLAEVAGQRERVGAGLVQGRAVAHGDEEGLRGVLRAKRASHFLVLVEERGEVTAPEPGLFVAEGEGVLRDADDRQPGEHAEMAGEPEPARMRLPVAVADHEPRVDRQALQRGEDGRDL